MGWGRGRFRVRFRLLDGTMKAGFVATMHGWGVKARSRVRVRCSQ